MEALASKGTAFATEGMNSASFRMAHDGSPAEEWDGTGSGRRENASDGAALGPAVTSRSVTRSSTNGTLLRMKPGCTSKAAQAGFAMRGRPGEDLVSDGVCRECGMC